uniref:TonB-dependent siderophore receptor n=1 Tax=Vogesella oryzae TaxID=1735285 RepID=UPI0015817B22
NLTGPLGDSGLAYRVIGELEESDYWRNFGNTRRKLIAPSLAWHDGNSSALLSYEYLEFKTPYDRGTVFANGKPVNIPREQRLDEAWNIAEGSTQTLNGSYSRELNDHWQLRASVGWNLLQYSDNQARPVSYNATTGVLTRRADGNRNFDNSTLLLSTRLQGDVQLLGQRHQPAIALESEQQSEAKGDVLQGSNNSSFNVYDPVYGTLAYPSKISNSKSDTRSDIDSQALVLQDIWDFAGNWSASLGSRYQHYRQEDGSGRPYRITASSSGDVLLPQLGLLYKLAPQWSLYGNYSESFKPNAASDGTSFDPERGIVHEVGGKYEHGGISASLALYRILKRNVLVTENDVSRTVGKVRSQGVELDVSGQLSRQLSLIANYAHTDAKVTEDVAANVGKQLYNVPRHSGAVSLAYDFGRDPLGNRWRAGGGMRYVGTRQGDASNSFELPRYRVADAFVAWQSKLGHNKLDVQLNVKNLFDKTYYSSSSGSALQVKIGDPREVSVQARLSF